MDGKPAFSWITSFPFKRGRERFEEETELPEALY
jgi:hypothetical protein